MVEAMEIVEMYCDLLLARFGLVESMKYIYSYSYKTCLKLNNQTLFTQ